MALSCSQCEKRYQWKGRIARLRLIPNPLRRQQYYGFSRLTRAANTLVFSSLAAGNAAYQIARAVGGASAVGPILLGLSKPIAAMQQDASVDEIVNMTSHVVLKAQQLRRGQVRA